MITFTGRPEPSSRGFPNQPIYNGAISTYIAAPFMVPNYGDVLPMVSRGTIRNGTKPSEGFYKYLFAHIDGCLVHCVANLIITEHLH